MNLTFPYTKYGRHWPNLQILLAMWFSWFHLNETIWDSQRMNSLNCDKAFIDYFYTMVCACRAFWKSFLNSNKKNLNLKMKNMDYFQNAKL
jgi:hypothetical protein